ncbi:MAG: hypothetical protein AUK02_00040 [Anaerolineae bacterium CG2_30_58_95]|nr:MAG: hypothetical protein AUK02_00040 [Anaerolineae bacterium CG2_30_58_95]PIU90524.1 MAG: hypothetical protein COS63_03125 [Anaerolineae bacterium CG06_land_8_20_14_3_00_57_67]PJH76055.1 MAG: hypothetical protein CO064_03350 [Anaerolineae bacterium CG_4_9_14_0_8_um_filter_58_9]
MTKEDAFKKNIKIERVYPDGLKSYFVANVVVQHQPDCFILSFFEVFPPAILGETDDEKIKALNAIDHVEAKCVARLVLTPSTMKEFLDAMSENWKNYENLLQIQTELRQK